MQKEFLEPQGKDPHRERILTGKGSPSFPSQTSPSASTLQLKDVSYSRRYQKDAKRDGGKGGTLPELP